MNKKVLALSSFLLLVSGLYAQNYYRGILDISGTWIAKVNSSEWNAVFNVIAADAAGGVREYAFTMGAFPGPGQQVDWYFYMPERLKYDGKTLSFNSVADATGDEYSFTLKVQNEELVGIAKLGRRTWPLTFVKKELSDIYAMVNEEYEQTNAAPASNGYTRPSSGSPLSKLGLDRKYQNAYKPVSRSTAFGFFSDAWENEGQIVLEFANDDDQYLFYIENRNSPMVKKFFPGFIEAAQPLIQEPFLIWYEESNFRDSRGNLVWVNSPVEIVAYDRDRFSDFGWRNALNLYKFLDELSGLVEMDNLKALVEIIDFPLTIHNPSTGKDYDYNNPEEFIDDIDHIFNGKVKNAIMHQSRENLFVNYNGVMIGEGELWFSIERGDELMLYAINPF